VPIDCNYVGENGDSASHRAARFFAGRRSLYGLILRTGRLGLFINELLLAQL
jgi:hypothetical protein